VRAHRAASGVRVAWSPDGALCATASGDNAACVFGADDLSERLVLRNPSHAGSPPPAAPAPRPQIAPGDAPGAGCVARRALALAAVVGRGALEGNAPRLPDPEAKRRELLDWVEAVVGLRGELEPDEAALLDRPCGRLPRGAWPDAVWRVEGLGGLLWALGRLKQPPWDELVDVVSACQAAGIASPARAGVLSESGSSCRGSEGERSRARGGRSPGRWRLARPRPDRARPADPPRGRRAGALVIGAAGVVHGVFATGGPILVLAVDRLGLEKGPPPSWRCGSS